MTISDINNSEKCSFGKVAKTGNKCIIELEDSETFSKISSNNTIHTKTKLSQWVVGKTSANESCLDKLKIDSHVIQRHDRLNTVRNVAAFVTITAFVAVLFSLEIAFLLYGMAGIEQILLVPLWPLFRPDVVVPWGMINKFLVASVIFGSIGIISGIISGCSEIQRSKLERQARMQRDYFKKFVSKYLEQDLKFKPKVEDLSDRNLHEIYLNSQNALL